MSIAISEEHLELSRVARSFLESNEARAENHAQLEAEQEQKPSFWKDMAALGWMGLHVPEQFGGQGFGLCPSCPSFSRSWGMQWRLVRSRRPPWPPRS